MPDPVRLERRVQRQVVRAGDPEDQLHPVLRQAAHDDLSTAQHARQRINK
jgi:hypothetical protein